MSRRVLVDQLVEVLEQIGDLLPDDRDGWDNDVRTRLAVERLWITAGNVAEAHRIAAGLDVGAGPWAELYRLRNLLAHALPGDLSSVSIPPTASHPSLPTTTTPKTGLALKGSFLTPSGGRPIGATLTPPAKGPALPTGAATVVMSACPSGRSRP